MSQNVRASQETPLITSSYGPGATSRTGEGYGATVDIDDDSIESNEFSPLSYRKLIQRYVIIVPLFTVVTLALVILTLHLLFPPSSTGSIGILRRQFVPFIAAGVTWTASHAIKAPLWSAISIVPWMNDIVRSTVHVFLVESLRLGTLFLLRPPSHFPPRESTHPQFFHVACWAVLGWTSAEVFVSLIQGYQQLNLYRELFGEPATYIVDQIEVQSPTQIRPNDFMRFATNAPLDNRSGISLPLFIEDQLDSLARVKYLTELEDIYGVPIPDIPIFIMVLQRIDSILLSLGLTLILSSCLMEPSSTMRIFLTYLVTSLIHTPLSILWTPISLPRIGVPTASYIALMASIGCIWTGLWRWGIVD